MHDIENHKDDNKKFELFIIKKIIFIRNEIWFVYKKNSLCLLEMCAWNWES